MPTSRNPILVRPTLAGDLDAVAAIDPSFNTDYVWQMELLEDDRLTQASFREVRLPRTMRVAPSRSLEQLAARWSALPLIIVAESEQQVRGVLAVSDGTLPKTAFVTDCVVDRRFRRRGIGTALLSSAIDWAAKSGLNRLTVETQSKNFPAIAFCRKHGLAFCGYNECYYPNQDIALFFGLTLK